MKTTKTDSIPKKMSTEKGLVIHTMDGGAISITSRYLNEGKSFVLSILDMKLLPGIIKNHHIVKKISDNPYEEVKQ